MAPSTRSAYQRAWHQFILFARTLSFLPSIPISSYHASLFVTHLLQKNPHTSSIPPILSGIAYFHKIRGHPDPFQTFLIKQLLQGGHRIATPSSDKRRPISEDLLLSLIDAMSSLNLSSYDFSLFSTMFLFAFYFGLRISEFTSSCHNLSFSDVTVSSDSITIIFRSFKHSSRPSLPHILKPTNLRFCPCKAALTYIRKRPSLQGPFFISAGKPVSPRNFSYMLKRLLPLCNKEQHFYSPHSFRIGAATHWFKKGLSEERIRFLGRWSSNAFLSYIRSEIDHSI